jgi:transcriptional regulator with XRE-family HTH domain
METKMPNASTVPVDSALITGEVVRRYRRLLGLQQTEFAARWGLTQSALSQIEGGRLGISDERAELLAKAFAGIGDEMPFSRFAQQFTRERKASLPLVGHPAASYTTLVVWRWTDGIDLAAEPVGLQPAGLVTLRIDAGARAFAVEAPVAAEERHETLVFVPVPFSEIESDDLILYQRSSHGPATAAIASVEHIGQTSSRRTRFQPILPLEKKAREVRPQELTALLRCVYRAQYTA